MQINWKLFFTRIASWLNDNLTFLEHAILLSQTSTLNQISLVINNITNLGFTSLWPFMLQSSPQRRLIMNNWLYQRSPTLVSSQPTRWSSVTQDMASTWPAACSTEEMWSPRMSMQPLPPSRPREPSSLLTGVQQDSRLVSTTSHQLWFLEETWLKFQELSVCSPTRLPLLRPGQDLITSLIWCTPSVHLFIGMLEREWRKGNFLRQEKI